jgi:hypothetical protein
MKLLIDIETGLENRYGNAGHDVYLNGDMGATHMGYTCLLCGLSYTVKRTDAYSGYVVYPDITTMDSPCRGKR